MKYPENITALIFFLISVAILAIILKTTPVLAGVSDSVSATIKISVCGNEIIEGGEDCEGEDLNGQTCESLGYGSGTLTCDIACSFDTSLCPPAPSPSPSPTPSPTTTTTSTTTSPAPAASLAPEEVKSSPPTTLLPPVPLVTSVPIAVLSPREILPPIIASFVASFDLDGSGRIESKEVFEAVKSWVDGWKEALIEEIKLAQKGETLPEEKVKKCDLNSDRRCNLVDLSILLYYIGK